MMMHSLELSVPAEAAGARVDAWLAANVPDMTRSALQRLCDEDCVTTEGKALAKNHRLHGGEALLVALPALREAEAKPQAIPLEIVYEDSDLLVVNKPKGMVVHPAAGNPDGTLVNALLHHCKDGLSGVGGVVRPGIVHRIDKDTSGLLIVAKNDIAHNGLARQIQEHSFLRVYEAVAYGNLKENSGTVDAPIGRHPVQRKKMCVTQQNSRSATTHYEVLSRYRGFTHIQCRLETGRTHQIRVHMAYLGHPLVGDPVYGPKKVLRELDGQCLHARVIGFVHPVTGKQLSFTSELPVYFTKFLSGLTALE